MPCAAGNDDALLKPERLSLSSASCWRAAAPSPANNRDPPGVSKRSSCAGREGGEGSPSTVTSTEAPRSAAGVPTAWRTRAHAARASRADAGRWAASSAASSAAPSTSTAAGGALIARNSSSPAAPSASGATPISSSSRRSPLASTSASPPAPSPPAPPPSLGLSYSCSACSCSGAVFHCRIVSSSASFGSYVSGVSWRMFVLGSVCLVDEM
eukprot:scaffold28926_cov63-Phaeocystis_antarctica.AAC.4